MSKIEDTLTQFMKMSITNQKNTDASIKNLEVQVGQLAKHLPEHGSGSFSTNTPVNLKEQCKAITTRRGTVVGLKDGVEKKKNEGVVEKMMKRKKLKKKKMKW